MFATRGAALLALAALLCFRGWGASAAPAPKLPEGGRYLFIVDISYSMGRLSTGVQNAMVEMIEGGLDDRMQTGDTYGVWTFNDRLHTDFPMQVWYQTQRQVLAAKAAAFLHKQHYEKPGHLAPVLADMLNIIQTVRDVTVMIVSDGDDKVRGTPFDKEINAAVKAVASRMHDAKKPVIIALVAQQGQIVKWGVNSPETLVPLPTPSPENPSPEANALAGTRTNAPPEANPAQANATNASPPNPVALTPPVVSESKSPQEQPPASIQPTRPSMAATQALAPGKSALAEQGNATVLPASGLPSATVAEAYPRKSTKPRESIIMTHDSMAPKPVAQASNPPPAQVETSASPAVAATPPAPAANSIPAVAAVSPSLDGTGLPNTRSAAASSALPAQSESPPASEKVAPPAANPAPNPAGQRELLLIGIGFLIAAALAGLFVWQRHRAPHEPSLITQSLPRFGK